MIKYALPLPLLLLCLALSSSSCKKEPGKRSSYWFIGADSFSSNSAAAGVVSGILSLSSHATNNPNSFRVSFKSTGSLPVSGTYRIRPIADTSDVVAFDCWYKGKTTAHRRIPAARWLLK